MASNWRDMESTSHHTQAQPGSGQGLLRLLLPPGLALLLFFALVVGSFHHHPDLEDHPDCAICAVAHHHPAGGAATAPLIISLQALPLRFVTLVLTAPVARPASLLHGRAPPQ